MSFFGSSSRTPPTPAVQVKPTKAPEIWFGPVPAARDMIESLSSDAVVKRIAAVASVYQFYEVHLASPPHQTVGPNTVDAIRACGALRRMAGQWMDIALESPVVKDYSTTPAVIRDIIHNVRLVLDEADAQGLPVRHIVMDEPLSGGLAGKIQIPAILGLMEQYIRAIRASHPYVQIGWVEGFNAPAFAYDEPIRMTDRLRERGCSPDFLHYDIDWWVCRTNTKVWALRLREVLYLCRARNLPLGVVLTGHADNGASAFVADALELHQFYRTTFQKDWPDRVIVQSWGEATMKFTIPPVSGPSSLLELTQRVHADLT